MPDPPAAPSLFSSGSALFLDFDGTLVDIAPRPDAVVVDPALPELLESLRTTLGGALAVVTGRPIADIDGFLPGLALDACGLHGLERRVGGRTWPLDLPDLQDEIDALERRLAPLGQVLVENKKVGVAVHWRLAPDAEGEARAAIDALAARLGPGYRIQDGKAVREIVPVAAGKGQGIRALLSVPPYRGRRPIFVGDDRTDEDGFAAANEVGGVSIKVGPGATAARFRVESPEGVRGLLGAWCTGSDDRSLLDQA